jgi:hypothetical protein
MSAMTKYKEEVERLKASKAAAITKVKTKANRIQHEIIVNATAYIAGAADASGQNPLPDVFGLNNKLVWGVVVHALAVNVSGKTGEAMSSIGTGLCASYAYCAGAGKGYEIKGYEYNTVSGSPDNFVVDDIEV